MKIDVLDDLEFLVAIKISRSPTGPDGPSDLGRSGLFQQMFVLVFKIMNAYFPSSNLIIT